MEFLEMMRGLLSYSLIWSALQLGWEGSVCLTYSHCDGDVGKLMSCVVEERCCFVFAFTKKRMAVPGQVGDKGLIYGKWQAQHLLGFWNSDTVGYFQKPLHRGSSTDNASLGPNIPSIPACSTEFLDPLANLSRLA